MAANTESISVAQDALPVICAATADRYRGAEAASYEARRRDQDKWKREAAALSELFGDVRGGVVADIPVGTGRFFQLYSAVGFKEIHGADRSEDMLAEAWKVGQRISPCPWLTTADILSLPYSDRSFDWVVCVRLLNLLSEAEMQQAVRELCRVASSCVVLSIRLGDAPWRRRMSITHTHEAFAAAIPEGWAVDGDLDLQDHGYRMIRLRRAPS